MIRFFKISKVFTLREYVLNSTSPRKEIAQYLNISTAYLSMLVNDTRKPGRSTALRISRITGIPLENLIQ